MNGPSFWLAGIGCVVVEATGKANQVAKVNSLDGCGSRGLACELVSTARIAGVSDDKNIHFLTHRTGLSGGTPLLVRIRALELHPLNFGRCSLKVHTSSTLKPNSCIQEPMT